MAAGGDSGDWSNKMLGIPSAEAELGLWKNYQMNWFPKTEKNAFSVVSDNIDWVEKTFEKLGNELKIEPIGYKKIKSTHEGDNRAILQIKVYNLGLSDQIYDNIPIRIANSLLKVEPNASNKQQKEETAKISDLVLSQTLGSSDNVFYLNGLERRKSSIFNIPVQLKNPDGHDNFYDKYSGPIDTVIEFK